MAIEHLFPLEGDKYQLVTDKYQHLIGNQFVYQEYMDGVWFNIWPDKVTIDEGHEQFLPVVEQLQRDILENVAAEFSVLEGVVIPSGGYYRLKKPRAVLLTKGYGADPAVYETFYPWAPYEFAQVIPTLESAINKSVSPLGLTLTPIIDGEPDYTQTFLVLAKHL